jgi:putative secretion ATPase (PEP-CTERM system associated)
MFDNFYGLTGKPFQLTPDPAFYFRSVTHRKALSYLGYGLAQGEGFVVITGEVGSGKSTLVAHLMSTVDPERLTVGQVVTSKLDDDEIIHVVAQSFGLDIEGHDKASALGAIEGFLHEEARAGRRCLLVVDESQNLEIPALEELRMLSNFQLGNHALLQTLLLGQPEFRTTLQSSPDLEQLRQRVLAAHHLEPMEKGEIEPYMIHRLEKVGYDGNPSFDQRVFAELYEASGGIPRRVNQIANRLLLLGAVEERTRIDAAMLKAVLDEMAGEKAFPAAAPQPMPKVAPTAAPVAPLNHEPRINKATIEAMLAERDQQIAELQQAVVEMAGKRDEQEASAVMPEIVALQERIAQLEARSFEQERSIRHTLTMLIEWIESEMDEAQAA